MQRHSFDAKAVASASKIFGAVFFMGSRHSRKKQPFGWQGSQQIANLVAEFEDSDLVGFPAMVTDGLMLPIDVYGLQVGNVSLGAAQMPAEFVKGSRFWIELIVDDERMFAGCDRPLHLVSGHWPLFFSE